MIAILDVVAASQVPEIIISYKTKIFYIFKPY